MEVIIDASEVHELADDISRHADETTGRVERVIERAGHTMHALAIEKAPRLTGLMDASDNLTITGLGFELGPTVDYGAYQELGTSRMAANPFLGPAWDEVFPVAEREIGDVGADVFSRG